MGLLTTSLFLSVIAMTSAIDDISDDLNAAPLSEELYLFDVTSDASYDDIRCSFGNITVRHSFKVIGERNYKFVALSEDINALRELRFPDGSAVTQYLMQHVGDYLKLYGVENGWEENDTQTALPDAILTMGELEFHFPHGMRSDEVNWRIENYRRAWTEIYGKIDILGYTLIGAYPTHGIFFAHMDLNAIQNVYKDTVDVLGGPPNLKQTLKHVVQIKTQPIC